LTRSLSAFILVKNTFFLMGHVLLDFAADTYICCSVMGYTLLLSLIEYKTLVMRGDLERANEVLPSIPKAQYNRFVAIFLFQKDKLLCFYASLFLV
jgi:hypothetical protein